MREEYLGRVHGISQCRRAANAFVANVKLQSRRWDYICVCRIHRGSSCYSCR